jgi:hypothetical protein
MAIALAAIAAAPLPEVDPVVQSVLSRDLKFSTDDFVALRNGRIVKHALTANNDREVAVVGAVLVNTHASLLVDRLRDIVQFKRGPNIVAIGRFSNPPTIDDLAPLKIEGQDLDLRACRVGNCDIRLPADVIRRFQREIDWSAPNANDRAAALFKEVLVESVRAYLSGGPGRITEYNGGRTPIRAADDFVALLKNSPYIVALVPGLPGHLEAFPSRPLPGAEDFLYWSKEKFGLTPFITVTHVTIVRALPGAYVITSKDVYSSRYVDASTIASDAAGAPNSFYLVYANRSRAQALKGVFGGLRRTLVERRAKSSLEENLRTTKFRLERGV